MERTPKNMIYSEKHQRNVCNTTYHRLRAMANYESTIGVLKSRIKLVKPTLPTVAWETEDFDLSCFTEHPVEVIYVEGNHVTILDNLDCAEQVNAFLQDAVHLKDRP